MSKVIVSAHACDEAVKTFRVPRTTADEWIRHKLRQARFIANIISKEGKPSRLFGYQRIAFILADTEEYVITVYDQNSPDNRLHSKVEAFVLRALKAAERKERAMERRVRIEKARLAVEIAQCRYKMEVTPSAAVVRTNTARIAQFDAKMAELDRELFEAKREKSSLAKSIVAYL